MAADSGSAIDRDAIFQIIRTQLAEILEMDAASISLNATFSDLGADSLALIELVEALEDALASYAEGFHIDDEDLEGLASVSDAVNYVATKLQVA